MNRQKLIDEIKKLFNTQEVITGYFNGSTFLGNNNITYNYNDLILTTNAPGRGFIVKYNNKYLFISELQNNIKRVDILSQVRRKNVIKKKIEYKVKTISRNNNKFFLGGDRKDKVILNNNAFLNSNHYVTNKGKNKYNISVYQQLTNYINKQHNTEEELINTNLVLNYLGNGFWESNNTSGIRKTLVNEEIKNNSITQTSSPGYDRPCRVAFENDRDLNVYTWTPENANSRTFLRNKLTSITFEPDPDITERNPKGIIIEEEDYSIGGSFDSNTDDENYSEFNKPIDNLTTIEVGQTINYKSVLSGNIIVTLLNLNVTEETINIVLKTEYNINEAIYRNYIYDEVDPVGTGFTFYTNAWEFVTNRPYETEGTTNYTETIIINKSNSQTLSSTKNYDDGRIILDNNSNNIINNRYNITSQSNVPIFYNYFPEYINLIYSQTVTENSTEFNISESLNPIIIGFPLNFLPLSPERPVLDPVETTQYKNSQFKFVPFLETDECETKGRIKTQNYNREYGGTFLAYNTTNGYILQTISGNKNIFYGKDGDTYLPPLTTNYTANNSLTLKYNNKSIILNTSRFLILKNFALNNTLNLTTTSFSLNYSSSQNINFILGLNFVLNTQDSFLIKGIVTGINNNTINCSVISIKKNVDTSFKGSFILNNGSFFNYYLRLGQKETATTEEIKKYILNPFIKDFPFELINIYNPNIFKNDSIESNNIYIVVKTINDIAYIENWNILENGNVLFNKVFQTPYIPLNNNSIPFSNSYYSK